LMRAELHLVRHAGKYKVAAVIGAGNHVVKGFVINPEQHIRPRLVLKQPVPESLLDLLLLAAGDHGFLGVDDVFFLFLAILVDVAHLVADRNALQIQSILQNLIGVFAAGAKAFVDLDGIPFLLFAGDKPLVAVLHVFNIDAITFRSLMALIGAKGFVHELRVICNGYPGGADAVLDIAGKQVFRLDGLQGLHIAIKKLRVVLRPELRVSQLILDIAGQVFLIQLPALI